MIAWGEFLHLGSRPLVHYGLGHLHRRRVMRHHALDESEIEFLALERLGALRLLSVMRLGPGLGSLTVRFAVVTAAGAEHNQGGQRDQR